MDNLKDRVLQTINKALKHWCYTGKYDVECDSDHYVLKLYLNQPEAPLCLNYWGTENGFLKFIDKEIRTRCLQDIKYYTAIQTDPGNDFIHTVINE
jgi:hypothetical protein